MNIHCSGGTTYGSMKALPPTWNIRLVCGLRRKVSHVINANLQGVANYHPDWEMESQFLTMDLHRVMALDSTVNSHPIVQEVAHPDQITEIFDTISYAKGASVLRMLEQFMGEELFRKGVHVFLER